MNTLIKHIKAFIADEEGLTIVEYVVGAAVIATVLFGLFSTGFGALGTKLTAIVGNISDGSTP
ncbi:Flp family type IVb pilin [Aliivibrio kagoshimensis]|uniref:Flp family type IVb pilin n=1 Tax=Aliivibrio kagoshimensis TaxID=2910230 RepID=UPI003D0FF0B3